MRWKAIRASFLIAASGLTAAAAFLTACGGGTSSDVPADGANSTPRTTTPVGWETFDKGAVAGAVPPGWDLYTLSQEEALELAKLGLTRSNLASTASAAFERVEPSDLTGIVLVLVSGDSGVPNINLQPCFQDETPVITSENGERMAKDYAGAVGLPVEVVGDVAAEGKQYALLRVGFYTQFDTYQVFFGRAGCVSIATLTTPPGDDGALSYLRIFLSAIEVSR